MNPTHRLSVCMVPLLATTLLIGLLIAGTCPAWGQDLSADEIIQRVDENAYVETGYFESRMTIRTGRRVLVKEMQSWSDGKGNGLVTFTNAADWGTKYLKLDDELWMYFPDADDLVKISGHML